MSGLTYAAGTYRFESDDGTSVEITNVSHNRGHLQGDVRVIGIGGGELLEWGVGPFTDSEQRRRWANTASRRNGDSEGQLANLLTQAAMAVHEYLAPLEVAPSLVPVGEFIANTDLSSYYIIDRLIELGDLVVIAGSAKAGKTLLVMNLALAVASGTQFLGRYVHLRAHEQPHKVALILAEDAPRTIARRMAKMAGDWPETVSLHVGNFELSERNYDSVVERLRGHSMLIADPMLVVADIENLNDTVIVRRGLTLWQRLARDIDAAVVLVHHNRKPSIGAGAPIN